MAEKDDLEALLDELEPQARDAFMYAIRNITDETVLAELADRIAAGDLEGAIASVRIQPVLFNPLAAAQYTAYDAGGSYAAEGVRAARTTHGGRLKLHFDVRNPRAENWLRTESSRLVRGLTDTARDTIREQLSEGMSRGTNPKTVALDIAGRINKKSGRREGGVIGLAPQQARFVRSALDELVSGDPDALRNYLTRRRRDKRLDGHVARALKAGKGVPADVAERMAARYSDSLLKLRADTIARTEMILSLHKGQEEAMRQAVESGTLTVDQIVKIWRTASDARVRHSHYVLGQRGGKRVPFDTPFVSPATGAKMMHPGDRSLGALSEDVINCRCHAEYKVDYLSAVAAKYRARG